MSLITEELKPSVNTLEEVKKLQELVRKLEMQNMHLRNKQNTSKRRSISPVKELKPASQITPSRSSRKTSDASGDVEGIDDNNFNPKDEYFDDLDIIKLSDIEMSDDESWLYQSPKSSNHDQENSYKWLRKDVDDLEYRQLQFTKNALLSKVTELNTSHEPVHVNSRTFTRSKKKQALEFLDRLDMISDEKVEKHCRPRRGSDVSSDSLSGCHILEDASDVEEVARLQEESLRMSSPLGTPKRAPFGLSRKLSTSSRGSASDQDLSESSLLGAPSDHSPGNNLVEDSALESYNHTDHSSPSESPYSSNISLHSSGKIQGKMSGYRRSLPNLNREPLAARQSKNSSGSSGGKYLNLSVAGKKTDTYTHISQKTRREYTSPVRIRQLNQTSNYHATPSNETATPVFKHAENTHLRPRSGLPRPSRASSASRSTPRSGIPTPSMLTKKT